MMRVSLQLPSSEGSNAISTEISSPSGDANHN